MAEHEYPINFIINEFNNIIDKTLGDIDNKGIFEHIRNNDFKLQKGVAGTVIEQCVLGYDPDNKQEADLSIIDNYGNRNKVELKVTGIRKNKKGEYAAKEPMSITAVGVYDIDRQVFSNSHFWEKIEKMLIVYYDYLATKPVPPYNYKDFPVKGYEFHYFSWDEIETLKRDWQYVHDLITEVVDNVSAIRPFRDKTWQDLVKQQYVARHSCLRPLLSFIDLAPLFPPRFRLKKTVVNTIVSKYFGEHLDTLPQPFLEKSEIALKCEELTEKYSGCTIGQLADMFGVPKISSTGSENKSIAEQVTVRMFGGSGGKLNKIEIFRKFGLIGKSLTLTPKGTRTEDMKLFQIDFDEMTRRTCIDEDTGLERPIVFEDSELYQYFAEHEFLCIAFEEPEVEYEYQTDENGHMHKKKKHHPLTMNKFLGFTKIGFSDEFIYSYVKKLWDDTRDKIFGRKLVDMVIMKADGTPRMNGIEISSAPNFMKSSENPVFIRGGGADSSLANKTEMVNNIPMLHQYVWIKGSLVCDIYNNPYNLGEMGD